MVKRLPDWPAAMEREAALVFSGVGDRTLCQYERLGIVRFKTVGLHGKKVAPKGDLERMLAYLFDLGQALPPSDDMEID